MLQFVGLISVVIIVHDYHKYVNLHSNLISLTKNNLFINNNDKFIFKDENCINFSDYYFMLCS
jgi:hypothetical protein